jgi:hypothetical protein
LFTRSSTKWVSNNRFQQPQTRLVYPLSFAGSVAVAVEAFDVDQIVISPRNPHHQRRHRIPLLSLPLSLHFTLPCTPSPPANPRVLSLYVCIRRLVPNSAKLGQFPLQLCLVASSPRRTEHEPSQDAVPAGVDMPSVMKVFPSVLSVCVWALSAVAMRRGFAGSWISPIYRLVSGSPIARPQSTASNSFLVRVALIPVQHVVLLTPDSRGRAPGTKSAVGWQH